MRTWAIPILKLLVLASIAWPIYGMVYYAIERSSWHELTMDVVPWISSTLCLARLRSYNRVEKLGKIEVGKWKLLNVLPLLVIPLWILCGDQMVVLHLARNELTEWLAYTVGILQTLISGFVITDSCIIHIITIRNLSTKMTDFRNGMLDIIKTPSDIDCSRVIKDFQQAKKTYKSTVVALSPIFTALNSLGFLATVHALINWSHTPAQEWFVVALFFLVEVNYFVDINKITDAKQDIKEGLFSPSIIQYFTSRHQLGSVDANQMALQRSHEMSLSLDWILMNIQVSGDFEKFKILGFEMEDTILFKKLFILVIAFSLNTLKSLGLAV